MATEPWTDTAFDYLVFTQNQRLFPAEELKQYWGRHIAWSLDGSRIVADAATGDELYSRLEELGIRPSSIVTDFIHDPESSYI